MFGMSNAFSKPRTLRKQAWYAFNEIVVGGVVINHVPSMRIDAQARLRPPHVPWLLCWITWCRAKKPMYPEEPNP